MGFLETEYLPLGLAQGSARADKLHVFGYFKGIRV